MVSAFLLMVPFINDRFYSFIHSCVCSVVICVFVVSSLIKLFIFYKEVDYVACVHEVILPLHTRQELLSNFQIETKLINHFSPFFGRVVPQGEFNVKFCYLK